MSRASASSVLLLISVLAGGCSVCPSAGEPARPTQWFAQQETVAQLPAEDPASNTFVFAGRDRIRTVTFAKGESPELLSVDGHKVPLGKGVQEIFFSPDGEHYAYAGQLATGHVAVVNGQPRPGLDPRSDMTISADSHHLAYIVSLKGADCAVIDGQLQPSRGMALGSISLSNDGRHWAYAVSDRSNSGGECMVIDGIRSTRYDQILSYQYQGDDLYYTASRDKNHYMVTPAGPGQPHEAVSDLYVSPDGKRLAWMVSDAQKQTVVVQSDKGPKHIPLNDNARLLAIGNDGRAICVTGDKGDYQVVMGDRQMPADGLPVSAIADPCSRRVAAIVVDRGRNVAQGLMLTTQTQHVELDGQKQPEYLMVRGLTFSPRGTHLAYWGMRSDLRWALVVDAQETLVFDSLPLGQNRNWSVPVTSPAPITFTDDGTLKATGINGRTVSRVTLSAQ